MSIFNQEELRCAVCGHVSSYYMCGSMSCFGDKHLDTRPGWHNPRSECFLQCDDCKYVAPNLEEETPITLDWVKRKEYAQLEGYTFESNASQRMFRRYLIDEYLQDAESCFWDLLSVAWGCDSFWEKENARMCRKMALSIVEENHLFEDGKPENQILLADLYRRSGDFHQVEERFANLDLGEEELNKLLQFEVEKAREQDTKRYTVKNALGESDEILDREIVSEDEESQEENEPEKVEETKNENQVQEEQEADTNLI